MESDDIQVKMLAMSTHCPGIERIYATFLQGAEYGEG
jgi:hypothetical protein